MRIAGIVRDSIVDGVGIRDVVFVQGCPHHCKGCHNPNTWNREGGTSMTIHQIRDQLIDSDNDVTISGGEPLSQLDELIYLTEQLHYRDGKRFWLYTGFTFEEIPLATWRTLWINGVDVVVDGKFIEDKKDSNLLFRGSSNQRLIDLPKSVKAGYVVEWEDNTYEKVLR